MRESSCGIVEGVRSLWRSIRQRKIAQIKSGYTKSFNYNCKNAASFEPGIPSGKSFAKLFSIANGLYNSIKAL